MYHERNTVAFYSDNNLSFLDYNWLNLSKLYAFFADNASFFKSDSWEVPSPGEQGILYQSLKVFYSIIQSHQVVGKTLRQYLLR